MSKRAAQFSFLHSFSRRLRIFHDFLAREAFFSLALLTALCLGMIFVRMYILRNERVSFLVTNLYLAWVPYLLSLVVCGLHQRGPTRRFRLLFPALCWLLFLPNGPYLITDLVHYGSRGAFHWWFDVFLFFSFAWTGFLLALASLNTMQRIVRQLSTGWISWFFVCGVVGLCGLGVYLGRSLRWNSWDMFFQPHRVLADLARFLKNPQANVPAAGISCLLAAVMFCGYLAYINFRLMPPLPEKETT